MKTLKDVRGGLEKIVRKLGNERGSGALEGLGLLFVAVGAIAAISTCVAAYNGTGNDFAEYHFNGNIGAEKVLFEERAGFNYSTLRVEKPDGRFVQYLAREGPEHQLLLEEVAVNAQGQETVFTAKSANPEMVDVVKRAEPDFRNYLDTIVKQKVNQYR